MFKHTRDQCTAPMPWDYENESGEQRRVMSRQTTGVEDTTHGAGQVDRVRHPPFAAGAVS